MQQHVLDDGVGPFAVLLDLVEVSSKRLHQFVDLSAGFLVEVTSLQSLPELIEQLCRERGEIVYEIERVLDLVSDTSGQLTERGELLRLNQAVLRSLQVFQRLC